MLDIKNLTVSVQEKKVLKDFDLQIADGEIHAIMGPNGVGKSTLCKVLMKDPLYEIVTGEVWWNEKNLAKLSPTEIAREKVYLLNQSPMAIEGVSTAEMLRMALSENSQDRIDIFAFNKKLEEICKSLDLPNNFVHREINVGMSGGERKKNELLQMWVLEPKLILLDEIDSGLDVDALKIVAKSFLEYCEKFHPTVIVITHHQHLLDYIKPDKVHVLQNGKIVQSGDLTLAKRIENEGFSKPFDISGIKENE